MSQIFNLKKSISLPFSTVLGGESAAWVTLFKKDYVVSYARKFSETGEKAFSLQLLVGRLFNDGKRERFAPEFRLGDIDITPDGRQGPIENQADLDEYVLAIEKAKSDIELNAAAFEDLKIWLATLSAALASLESDLATAIAEKDDKRIAELEIEVEKAMTEIVETQSARDNAEKAVETSRAQLADLEKSPVEPKFSIIDTFGEVVEYFEKDGSLTEAGREWAFRIPLKTLGNGATIGDFVEA